MATLQQTTASNAAAVDSDQVEELREYLDACHFVGGTHGALRVSVDENGDNPTVTFKGSATGFQPVPPSEQPEDADEYTAFGEDVDYEVFLTEIAEYLTEKLVIQTVGHEKTRFPLVARQHTVTPDGEIDRQAFDW